MRRLRLTAALAASFVCVAANAAQTTTTLGVSANVTSGCGVTANPIAFGSYPGTAASPTVDAQGSIIVTCPAGDGFDLRINNGTNANGGQRRMRITSGPASYLNYELYRDAARTLRFGNANFERVTGTGTGAPQTVPVYGRLPGSQIAPLGAYLDTIQVTLQF